MLAESRTFPVVIRQKSNEYGNTTLILIWSLFIFLPVESFLNLDLGSAKFRFVYIAMLSLIVLNLYHLKIKKSVGIVIASVFLASIFSSINTINFLSWLGGTIWSTFCLMFFVSFIFMLRKEKVFKLVLNVYSQTVYFWSFVIIGQFILAIIFPSLASSIVGGFPRVSGPLYEPSFVPVYIGPLIALFYVKKDWSRLGVASLAIILCSSRTGWLMLALIYILLFLFFGEFKKYFFKQTLAVAAFICLVFFLDVKPVQNYVQSSTEFVAGAVTLQDQGSTLPRLSSWEYGYEVFLTSPIFGVGLGNYGAALQQKGVYIDPANGIERSATETKTTNLYVEVLAETGIVGLLAFLFWLTFPFFFYNKHKNREISALFVGWICLIAIFPLIQTWYRPYIWVFASLLYYMVIYRRKVIA